MNHNFKEGELALTLAGNDAYPAMTQVELIVLLSPGEVFHFKGLDLPLVKAAWLCRSRDWEMIYQPSDLMPLRGAFQPEQQKLREVVA